MRTNVPGIYAIGDVTGKLQLAHVAEAMGVVAAETIAGAETHDAGRLPDDAPRDVLPAAGRPVRADRGAGPDEGYDVKGQFPFTANGKAHGWPTRPASSR